MEKRILLPRTYIEKLEKPLIFLAGPIRYAQDWQEKAIDYLLSNDNGVIIANPRWDAGQRIKNLAINGESNYFKRQRVWERYYLKIASHTGAVLFWLANAPGFMTRFELGQISAEYKHNNSTRFCVGGEKGFIDIDTIRYDLSEDAPDKEIFDTLEETCSEAIKLAQQRQ
jgi:hypothetical protein